MSTVGVMTVTTLFSSGWKPLNLDEGRWTRVHKNEESRQTLTTERGVDG